MSERSLDHTASENAAAAANGENKNAAGEVTIDLRTPQNYKLVEKRTISKQELEKKI